MRLAEFELSAAFETELEKGAYCIGSVCLNMRIDEKIRVKVRGTN